MRLERKLALKIVKPEVANFHINSKMAPMNLI